MLNIFPEMRELSDFGKIIFIAEILGHEYKKTKKSFVCIDWGKRFLFDDNNELIKIQKIKLSYETIGV